MHIHAAWQMGTEYRDAFVYQARVEQARKVFEGSEDFQVKDSIKSAMSPFLVLEVRRDHFIEDTLVQIQLKVRLNLILSFIEGEDAIKNQCTVVNVCTFG